jgi:hypothetical protein
MGLATGALIPTATPTTTPTTIHTISPTSQDPVTTTTARAATATTTIPTVAVRTAVPAWLEPVAPAVCCRCACADWNAVELLDRKLLYSEERSEGITKIHRLSSSLRCRMASRMRLASLEPLRSPCRTLMLVITFFHPASTFSFARSSLLSTYLRRLSCARCTFSSSFRTWNSYSCRLPSSRRFCLSSHSRSYILAPLRFSP